MEITKDYQKIRDFFSQSETWQEGQPITRAYILDNKSGCCLFEFDGIVIVFNVFTKPEYRRQGLARNVLAQVLQDNQDLLVLLRANDETKQIFEKSGFQIIKKNKLNHYYLGK